MELTEASFKALELAPNSVKPDRGKFPGALEPGCLQHDACGFERDAGHFGDSYPVRHSDYSDLLDTGQFDGDQADGIFRGWDDPLDCGQFQGGNRQDPLDCGQFDGGNKHDPLDCSQFDVESKASPVWAGQFELDTGQFDQLEPGVKKDSGHAPMHPTPQERDVDMPELALDHEERALQKLDQATIDRLVASMAKSSSGSGNQASQAAPADPDAERSELTSWQRDTSQESQVSNGAEWNDGRQSTWTSSSFGRQTTNTSTSERRTPSTPTEGCREASDPAISLISTHGGSGSERSAPAGIWRQTSALVRQTTGRSTKSASCAAKHEEAPRGAAHAAASGPGASLELGIYGAEGEDLPETASETMRQVSHPQSSRSSAGSTDGGEGSGSMGCLIAPDLVRQLWLLEGGPSKMNASSWHLHFAPDCEYEDLSNPEPLRGRAAVQAMMPSLVLPPGSRRVVDKISGGPRSCGFTWHIEEDGIGVLQRGMTFLSLDRRGKICYLRESSEPMSKASLSSVIERCTSPNLAVRQAALKALRELAANGTAVLPRILARIEQAKGDATLLEGLMPAVAEVAVKGDEVAVSILLNNLGNSSCWVRLHCVAGLGKLAAIDDMASLDKVAPCAQDDSWQVREAAAEALGNICGPVSGHESLGTLANLVQDPCARVRTTASTARDKVLVRLQLPVDANASLGATAAGASGPKQPAAPGRQRTRARKGAAGASSQVVAAVGSAVATAAVAVLLERLLAKAAR